MSPLVLSQQEPSRVCLIKPSSLGDIVHALPVLDALRERWPGASFHWVVNRGLRGLLDGHPGLDGVIPFDRSACRASLDGWRALRRFEASLRGQRFDLAIDLQGLFRSGWMAWATRSPVRVGLAGAREGAGLFYTHRVSGSKVRSHAVDRLLDVALAFGARIDAPRFTLPASQEAHAWAARRLASVPQPRVVLNVGARWVTKRWPAEQFAALARRAHEVHGAGLIAVGASEDRELVDRLGEALGGRPLLDLCGQTTLPQLAAVAAQSALFVSNDTGPLHLAVAAGCRVVGVYTCTRPEWTGPYGPSAWVVRTGVPCAGSCVKKCPRMDCMRELRAAQVWPAVDDALRRWAASAAVSG